MIPIRHSLSPSPFPVVVALSLSLAACATEQQTTRPYDKASSTTAPTALAITNGHLHGAAGATAVLLAGEHISLVGSDPEIRNAAPASTRFLDAQGGSVLPGFHDAHIHLLSGGTSLGQLDLDEGQSLEEIKGTLKAYADAHPADPWLRGRGYSYGIVPRGQFPTRHDLDAVVKDRPVLLRAYDGHSAWANTRALELSGVTADSPDPPDGTLVREADGRTPAGTLLEGAVSLVSRAIPEPSRVEKKAALRAALADVARLGVTDVDAIESDEQVFPVLAELLGEGALPVRVSVSLPLEEGLDLGDPRLSARFEERLDRYEELRRAYASPKLRFGFLKGFVDGVIDAKTAYMLDPYESSTERGRPLIPPEALFQLVERAHARRFQVALHAIGDAAVRLALDAYEAAARKHPDVTLRHRVEHIEALDPGDAARFARLRVVASMQPFHANPFGPEPDKGVWSENLGARRRKMSFAWKYLVDRGAPLTFGSDWPVFTANPLQGLAVALTRRDENGNPPGGWNAEHVISLDAALFAYGVERGGPQGPSAEVGRIAPGQMADLVVLEPGVRLEDPRTLWKGRVAITITGGAVVHEAQAPERRP